jgi:hypothetical protein
MEADMSFVIINNTTDNTAKVLAWIRKTRNENIDRKITPEFAMEVLSKTNHSEHMKTILRNIGDKCGSIKERLEYKDFVLSAIEGRTHVESVYKYLKDLAVEGGYWEEFEDADKLPKLYDSNDCLSDYFIKMKDKEQNVLSLNNEIKYKGDHNMTPDIAKEYLEKTNHYAHIKTLVNVIENCCREHNIDEVEYKDVILSCVSHREVSPQSYEKLEEFAKRNGFFEEFEKINALPKVYDKLGNEIPKVDEKDRTDCINSLKAMSADQLKI